MESLVHCDTCHHGAIVHESAGCTFARCTCTKTLPRLIDEALEAAKLEIRREWQISS